MGRPNRAYVLAHGNPSYYEALFRLSLVRMALEQRSASDVLHRTDALRSLDPSEKGAVTYFLGMIFCNLFAHRLLQTPWLLHLDVFRDQLDPVLLQGRSRPDFIGQDHTGAWHAFESKGRSSVPGEVERDNAKQQALRVVSVDSTVCSLHVGAIAYFSQNALQFHWRDPEPEDPRKLAPIEVSLPVDAWRHHYAPAFALYSIAQPDSDVQTDADIRIEIHPAILGPLSDGEWTAARMQALEHRQALQKDGYRPDGLKVLAGPSWTPKLGQQLIEL